MNCETECGSEESVGALYYRNHDYGYHNYYGNHGYYGPGYYGHHNYYGNRNFYGNRDYHGHRKFYGNRVYHGHRNFYGNQDYYGHRNFYGNRDYYGNRNFYHNSMHGEEYGMQRKCYNEYWQNTDCSGERSFHSIFRYDMSTCISGMEIYGDNDQWWYTPTSRCRDSGCMDCEDFTSMPSRKHQCMPCSFRDNCSFMRVDCEYDDQYDGSRFGKTDSDQYFSEESVGSNSRASCMDRCQRRGDDQMDCQRRCESEESMSGRSRDVYRNRDYYGNRDYHGHRDFYGNRDFYGHRNFHGNHNFYGHNFHGISMNGEEYCQSEFMLRNEESCKASSCCQWNTWEEGDASFNGQGRCWSDIGAKMCTDIFEGSRFGESDSYHYRSGMSGRRHTIMDTEKSVGISSQYACMDQCQRDGNGYRQCILRCPRAEESVGSS